MNHPIFTLHLPDWLEKLASLADRSFASVEERMRFVIELSRLNIGYKTGGPFAAAIFRMDDGTLLAPGINMVLSGRCSVLHAEIVALMVAQQKAGTHDLSSEGQPPCELVTSTEPCAMCMGAAAWSGIWNLVCGARGADAEEAGFDEGEKPPAWTDAFERRGISVMRDICREQAVTVLRDYQAGDGIIYNPRQSKFSRKDAKPS